MLNNCVAFVTNLHELHDFCDLLSDVHCAVSLHVDMFYNKSTFSMNLSEQEKVRLWDTEKSDSFFNYFNIHETETLSNKLDELRFKQGICQADMDHFIQSLGDFHVETARKRFGTFHLKHNPCNSTKSRHWFNDKCKSARRKFHLAKPQSKLRKSETNKRNLKTSSTFDKQTLQSELNAFKNKNICEIIKIKKSDPKKKKNSGKF